MSAVEARLVFEANIRRRLMAYEGQLADATPQDRAYLLMQIVIYRAELQVAQQRVAAAYTTSS